MEKTSQIKLIGSFLGLWGLFRLVTSGLILTSSTEFSTILLVVDIMTGLILLVASIGLLLKKLIGFYAGLLGVLIVLVVNIYNLTVGVGENTVAILVNLAVAYYIYRCRGFLEYPPRYLNQLMLLTSKEL